MEAEGAHVFLPEVVQGERCQDLKVGEGAGLPPSRSLQGAVQFLYCILERLLGDGGAIDSYPLVKREHVRAASPHPRSYSRRAHMLYGAWGHQLRRRTNAGQGKPPHVEDPARQALPHA